MAVVNIRKMSGRILKYLNLNVFCAKTRWSVILRNGILFVYQGSKRVIGKEWPSATK